MKPLYEAAITSQTMPGSKSLIKNSNRFPNSNTVLTIIVSLSGKSRSPVINIQLPQI
jgi:hypothetical protein